MARPTEDWEQCVQQGSGGSRAEGCCSLSMTEVEKARFGGCGDLRLLCLAVKVLSVSVLPELRRQKADSGVSLPLAAGGPSVPRGRRSQVCKHPVGLFPGNKKLKKGSARETKQVARSLIRCGKLFF